MTTLKTVFSRLPIDPYVAAILGMVALGSVLPVHGDGAVIADHGTIAAIALLFFLHGARLEPRAALAGARHWRLHTVVLATTFLLFPVLGLGARALFPHLLTPALWTGVILLCVLPSTVQSSIAFTSIARGNVAAALCAATASNLLGMVLTPLLAGLLLSAHGAFSMKAVGDILLQLLLPFAAGQLSRPWLGGWALRNKTLLGLVDRGSILLVVYVAFSEGVAHGIWHQLGLADLGRLLVVDAVLLALVLGATTFGSRLLGFNRADEITVVFCGSKKSLASGLPMATVLLAGQPVGLIVLPLMLFHQIQLMACATLAKRYASAPAASPAPRIAVGRMG
ncbi:MAG TPA: bile acid:sodium symporter family protein [Rhodopila sp.]|nr:bile acid:sodium symporter family protein [Rhodopila sp.]